MTKTITLETPLKIGDTEVTEITLRKPAAGELRGLNLTDLLQMDVVATIKLLPRISTPTLTEQHAAMLDPADLTSLAKEVSGFLLPRWALA
ncbi:MAG: phage tail assembly protein [Pseudomonadota bacterium]